MFSSCQHYSRNLKLKLLIGDNIVTSGCVDVLDIMIFTVVTKFPFSDQLNL